MRARLAGARRAVPAQRGGHVACGGATALRLPVRPQDHPRRVRRQGRLVRRRRRASAPTRSPPRERRRPGPGRGAGRLPARALGAGRPLAVRPGRGLARWSQSMQRDGICHEVVAPAPDLDPGLAVEAQQIAMRVAGELDVTGVLAVELFETTDGRVLVNELAMRPHNTGHWTQDGAVTSQFENHLRAVLDLPLGAPDARAPWTVMVNILGGDAADRPAVRRLPARAGPRPAAAGAPLRQGAAAGPQGRPRQRLRRRPRGLPRAGPACGSMVPRRPRRRERAAMSRSSRTPRVGIVMGSDSDWPVMKAAAEALRGVRRRASRPTWSPRTGCPTRCSPTAATPPAAGSR